MEIGRKLKMERKKAGKSQQQIADHLLVTRQAISNWENEKSRPYIDTLIKICEYYKISLSYFTSVEDSQPIQESENLEVEEISSSTDSETEKSKIYKKNDSVYFTSEHNNYTCSYAPSENKYSISIFLFVRNYIFIGIIICILFSETILRFRKIGVGY